MADYRDVFAYETYGLTTGPPSKPGALDNRFSQSLTGAGIFFKLGFMGKTAAGKASPVGRKPSGHLVRHNLGDGGSLGDG